MKEAKKLGCSAPSATVIPTAVRKVLTSAQTLEGANEPKNPRIRFSEVISDTYSHQGALNWPESTLVV